MPVTAEDSGTAALAGRSVRRMGFGTMRLTANPDRDLAIRVLHRAVELGVNHLDTAAFYVSPGGTLGVGSGPKRYAAELIRAALSPYPDDLVIATKVVSSSPLRERVETNLRLLGVDALDVVNLRLYDRAAASLEVQFEELAGLQREGLIRHLGISNVHRHHLDQAQAIAPVVCVQNAYGVDLRLPSDTELLHECERRGIAFVPFFSVAGTGREKGYTAGAGITIPEGVSEQQFRIAWTLHQGPHVLAIPGTGSLAHLEENIAAGALRLPAFTAGP
ncbi:aldo/keto reductase [Actinoplanes sp. TFC3]|uniref:aldo/keto reductase n=1 Tax=Actinoplanes sp. TFC3 TaxID=1710355 RepID=UPI00082A94C5|nr:aldo/keto reductase [Actinoplanes sp. TFC3]